MNKVRAFVVSALYLLGALIVAAIVAWDERAQARKHKDSTP
jgi:hypothetical protein